MRLHMQLVFFVSATALAGAVAAQTASTSVGRAASAAVTPGDQNMGRTPDNRSGGLMGNDRTDRTTGTGSSTTGMGRAADAAVTPGDQDMGRNPGNRSGGLMGNDRTGTDSSGTGSTGGSRPARADRG
ncbi:MAG: hypothetical protein H7Z19_19725 [Chitinophagaceae bacterium]|nr:hypothetical protein [Rubrivivax sp.]